MTQKGDLFDPFGTKLSSPTSDVVQSECNTVSTSASKAVHACVLVKCHVSQATQVSTTVNLSFLLFFSLFREESLLAYSE